MELTFLRGACVIIESGDKRILCDPWLEDGVYYGSWAHYPPFPDTGYQQYGLNDIDFIYVSHVHPDHFDPVTMAKIQNKPPVLIHSYPTKFLKKHIESLGYEVIELCQDDIFYISPQLQLRIFAADDCDPAACGMFYGCSMPGVRNTQIDSMAVITDGRETIVNVNDCPFGLSKNLAEKIGREYDVTLALIAYAGAGPYPQCFAMSEEKKLQEAVRKRKEFIDGVAGFAKALRARRVFPFAGDYQLCGSLSALNELRGVPEVDEVYRRLRDMGISTLTLNPGGRASITSPGGHLFSSEIARKSYVHEYLSTRVLDYETDAVPSALEIDKLVKASYERFNAKRNEYGMKALATAYVQLGANYWFAMPPNGEPYFSIDTPAEHRVLISTDRRMLKRLLSGPQHAHWNNAQIGSHIQFDRTPNLYEPGLYHVLSFFHA